ncbi:hypothetical protein SAMN05444339_102318 [Loktanella atrilutea]|uniref:MetA-pathway of phenol degradation n=1 Tax=Loktanella atrilutea TaxID=366533 RepID=A0A1M4X296_LOKAT|nr:hypothetical protein [Loktanella atrilutea]SHE87589.1 hypothetical protein SAMN05444339_102318 [Loktanella atrilutea]
MRKKNGIAVHYLTLLWLLLTTSFATAQSDVKIDDGRLFYDDRVTDSRDCFRACTPFFDHRDAPTFGPGMATTSGSFSQYRVGSETFVPTRHRVEHRNASGFKRVYPTTGASTSPWGSEDDLAHHKLQTARSESRPINIIAQVNDFALAPNQIIATVTANARHTLSLTHATISYLLMNEHAAWDDGRSFQLDLILGELMGRHNFSGTNLTTLSFGHSIQAPVQGADFLLGGDVMVFGKSNVPLGPSNRSPQFTNHSGRPDDRWQLASGIALFYDATSLRPEIRRQTDGRITGSLKLNFNF